MFGRGFSRRGKNNKTEIYKEKKEGEHCPKKKKEIPKLPINIP